MKSRLLIVLVALLVPILAGAQSVSLTGTVTDTPDNQTWNNGTIAFTFFAPQGTSYRWTGGTLNPNTPITANLSSTGTYSISIPDNSQITPTDSSWNITVCPAVLPATSGCFKTNRVITSASSTLNLAPTSPRFVVPTIPQPVVPISAYNDTEIVGGWVGFSYYNLPNLGYRACLSGTIAGCTSYGSSSGAPGQFNVKNYGAVGDGKHSNNVALNATTTITSADNPWTSADVGKLIFCVFTGTPTNGFTAGTKIASFVSAGQVTVSAVPVGGAATYACTWATQDDTAAFQLAFTAASAGTGSANPNFASPTLAYPGTIYIPPGGYMVSGNIYDFNGAFGNVLAPSFKGAGSPSTIIYPRSDTFTTGARACLMDNVNGINFTWSGFLIMGSGWGFNCGSSGIPFLRLNVSSYFTLQDIFLSGIGTTNGGSPAVLNFAGAQNAYLNQVNAQGTSTNNASGAIFELDNSAGVMIEQSFFSNNTFGSNLVFNASGARNASGQQITMLSGGSDECGGGPTVDCVKLTNGSFVNFSGAAIFGEGAGAGNGALFVDGTSAAWLTSMNVGPFSTSTNSNGIAIASGGFVYATGSHIRGGGTTGSVVDGPVGAIFVDDGGNVFQRCNGATCSNITAAAYSGAFTSGIVPKSSLTHTPNTCYAVTGNLLATAQNLCIVPMDQNYQIIAATAQSGGTTPVNSSCATPPVITLSDGTRSFTMTMTSGKTQWSSSVDAVTNLNQVFASGTTLTVSIGANTCATPPSNVSVNYNLQSVLNQ